MSKDFTSGAEPEQLRRLFSIGLEESPLEQDTDGTASLDVFMEKPGSRIGRYKLLSVLGEGGMGIVYLAQQHQPVKRQVAVKIVKPGMDSKRVIARFEAERQALALLDHPNIAHVYDAGTTEAGRPYFVMEYVKGLPVTEHCDHYKLTIEPRLRLFQQVCRAVQHAHQKGIIHRDIKPSNILVSVEDNRAIPKVIDFGVAKALSMPLTERTLATEDSQLLGTPEYMSPEQADMLSEDIDTRSDIYSLGVLLYVLLTGVLPFESHTLRGGGIDNIRKVICETDPKTPSTRLTRLGAEAAKIAENRRTEIAALAKCLHRELEWIPLKAMRKERSQRYRSASELADDINKYLNGGPLIAGPPGTSYKLKKFVRRNRILVGGIAAVLVVLIAGIVISSILAIGQARARAKAHRIAYASDMRLAQHALDMNDMALARGLLEAHRLAPGEDDLRGWEWRYLWQECRSDALGELCRYEKPSPASVAYSPDGRLLAVGRWPEEVVDIWDVPSRKRIVPRQPMEGGSRLAFSPRGDLLATNAGNRIRLWQTGAWGRVDHGQLTLDGYVTTLKFSPDGTWLTSLSLSDEKESVGELTVWDVYERALVRQIPVAITGEYLFGDLAFSPDGKALVIGDVDGHLQIIDVASENTILDPWEAHSEGIISVAWSPNSSVIASGSGWEGGPIRLWDAASGKLLAELVGHTSWISDMVFSKDGLRLYSSSGDQTIRIWDVAQQRPLATLRGSSHEVLGLALSPDGATLASACKDGVVAFWSADPQQEEPMPRVIQLDQIARPAFTPDGRVLAVPQRDTVSLFDLATAKEAEPLPKMDANVSAVTYSPDGTLLVGGSEKGTIHIWSYVEHRLLKELDGHKERISLLRFRADGARMLSLDVTTRAIWWNTSTWQADSVVELPVRSKEYWWPVDVSPDGHLLALGTETGAVCWLDAETGKLLKKTSGDPRTMQVAFSGDGSRLASASIHGTVALWNPSSFTSVPFRAHLLGVQAVAFSPDGRRLATGGATSRDAVKLWDLSTRRELMTLPAQSALYRYVAFSNDGNWLAACGRGKGKLYLWYAPSLEEIEADEERLKSEQSH